MHSYTINFLDQFTCGQLKQVFKLLQGKATNFKGWFYMPAQQ